MIITELYNGQGLGNQLWCYVATRVLALDKGFEFGIMSPEKFKGFSFMKLDFGKEVKGGSSPKEGAPPDVLPNGIEHYYREKEVLHNGADVRGYDPEFFKIKDNTKIDGYFQGEDYIKHRKDEIREWLKVLPCEVPENGCIINFRGGEYKHFPDFFLPQEYWDKAIALMEKENPNMMFHVVTDDIAEARKFFPKFEITHDMELDYRLIQSANYLILSNSSFAFFPAWLGNAKKIIAPWGWGRHNLGFWSLGYAEVKGWTYI